MTQVIEETTIDTKPNPNDIHPPKTKNKSFTNLPIAEQLLIAQRALENTTNNPQIGDIMLRYGYDRAKIELFRTLYKEAQEANIQQTRENGDKVEAYADFAKNFEKVKIEYTNLRKFLRIVLKTDKEKLVKLQVAEPKKLTISGLLQQINFCYQNVLADFEVLQQLSGVGITEKDIWGYKANFDAADKYYITYFKENSEAIAATRIRDEKIEALHDFLTDFFTISKIAFASQPDLLKQIS